PLTRSPPRLLMCALPKMRRLPQRSRSGKRGPSDRRVAERRDTPTRRPETHEHETEDIDGYLYQESGDRDCGHSRSGAGAARPRQRTESPRLQCQPVGGVPCDPADPNNLCTGAGAPFACCTGAGTGTCVCTVGCNTLDVTVDFCCPG